MDLRCEAGERLNDGIHRHQRGDLEGASASYRAVLDAHPRHPIAAYLLSQLEHQIANDEEAPLTGALKNLL